MLMRVKEIQEVIPRRHPFLLTNCVGELEPGVRAVGYKCVAYDESFFKGHLPQGPVAPGVLLVKALAQTGTVAVLFQEGFRGEVVYPGGTERAEFKRKVMPDDKVKLGCGIIKQEGPVGVGKATATVDGKLAVSTELTFMVG